MVNFNYLHLLERTMLQYVYKLQLMDQMYEATEISEVKLGTALFLIIVSIIGSEYEKNCMKYCKYACLYPLTGPGCLVLPIAGTWTWAFEVHSPTPAAGVQTSLHTWTHTHMRAHTHTHSGSLQQLPLDTQFTQQLALGSFQLQLPHIQTAHTDGSLSWPPSPTIHDLDLLVPSVAYFRPFGLSSIQHRLTASSMPASHTAYPICRLVQVDNH